MGGLTFKDEYNSAITLYKKGDYESSLTVIGNAISLNPSNFQAFYAKGMILKKMDRLEEASKNYSLSLEFCNDPTYRKKILEKKEEIDNIINQSEFSDLLLLDDENSTNLSNETDVNLDEIETEIQRELDEEQYEDAIINIDKFIGYLRSEGSYSDADLEEYYVARSYAALKIGRISEAKEYTLKVLAINPTNETAISINEELKSITSTPKKIKPISKTGNRSNNFPSDDDISIDDDVKQKKSKAKKSPPLLKPDSKFFGNFDYSVSSFIYILLGAYIYSIIVFKINPFSFIALSIIAIIFLSIEISSNPVFKDKFGYLLIGISAIAILFQSVDTNRRIIAGESPYSLSIMPPPPSIVDYALGAVIVGIILYYLWLNLKSDILRDGLAFAPSLSRIKSTIVDGLVIFILFVISAIVLNMALKLPEDIVGTILICEIIAVSLLLELSPRHARIGKLKVGSKILNIDGTPASNSRILYRNLAKFGTIGTLGLGFLICLFTKNQQTMHDYVSGTCVVKDES